MANKSKGKIVLYSDHMELNPEPGDSAVIALVKDIYFSTINNKSEENTTNKSQINNDVGFTRDQLLLLKGLPTDEKEIITIIQELRTKTRDSKSFWPTQANIRDERLRRRNSKNEFSTKVYSKSECSREGVQCMRLIERLKAKKFVCYSKRTRGKAIMFHEEFSNPK